MTELPTAKEFLWKEENEQPQIWTDEVYPRMIEFAKLHVEKCIYEIIKQTGPHTILGNQRIKESYPLSNIK